MARRRNARNPLTALGGVLAAALLLGLSACSSGPQIITNSAPDFSIANYRTFGFLQPLSTDRGDMRTLESSRLIESATRELENLGLRRADSDAELLVNFILSSRETIETRPSTGGSVYYGRGRYGRWGGYGMGVGTTQEVVQRTEGTLAIDIIDAARNELVWEGAARGRVTDSMRENRQQVLDAAVAEIFLAFP